MRASPLEGTPTLALQPGPAPVVRGLRRIGRQAGGAYADDGGILVLLGGIAADADGADHGAGLVEHQHGAGHRDETAVGCDGERALEGWTFAQAVADGAARDPHAERAPGFAERDVGP